MIVLSFAIAQTTYAQWSFRATIHLSGRCDEMGRFADAVNKKIPDYFGYETRSECESARAYISSIRSSVDGCTVYVTASPCVGRDVGGGGVAGIATPTIGASAQGSSFFYTSVPEELKNWREEQNRIDEIIGGRITDHSLGLKTSDDSYNASLNKDLEFVASYSYGNSSDYNIGSGVFTGIPSAPLQEIGNNANLETIQFYLSNLNEEFYDYLLNHPSEIYSLLPEKYKSLTGLDIDVIISKDPASRSPEEQTALDNYNAYVKGVCDEVEKLATDKLRELDSTPEKKEVDMAILAKICYNDDEKGYESLTNYHRVLENDLIGNESIISLYDAVARCNATEQFTGLRIELFKNDLTGEYTIAFQGTNFSRSEVLTLRTVIGETDLSTDIQMLLNLTPNQFENLDGLIKTINDCGETINITGHSLGGALAGYVGLHSEPKRETYTFNAFGLNKTLLKAVPNYNDEHIRAYRSESERLVSLGQSIMPTIDGIATGGVSNVVPGGSVFTMSIPGTRIPVKDHDYHDLDGTADGLVQHKAGPLLDALLSKNYEVQDDWLNINGYKKLIEQSAKDSSLYRQDNITISVQ